MSGTHAAGQRIRTTATGASVPRVLVDTFGVPLLDCISRQTLAGRATGAKEFSPQLLLGNDPLNKGRLVAPNIVRDRCSRAPRTYITAYGFAANSADMTGIYGDDLVRGATLSREIRTIQKGNRFYSQFRDRAGPYMRPWCTPPSSAARLGASPRP